jgi:hypothetical protein
MVMMPKSAFADDEGDVDEQANELNNDDSSSEETHEYLL